MIGIKNAIQTISEAPELISYGEQPNSWAEGKNALNVSQYVNGYLLYDLENKYFVVQKNFYARITAWVENYQSSSLSPDGSLVVNDSVVASYRASGSYSGAKGGSTVDIALRQGDLIWVSTPNDRGYPAQRIKIYKTTQAINDFTANSETFTNEHGM